MQDVMACVLQEVWQILSLSEHLARHVNFLWQEVLVNSNLDDRTFSYIIFKKNRYICYQNQKEVYKMVKIGEWWNYRIFQD